VSRRERRAVKGGATMNFFTTREYESRGLRVAAHRFLNGHGKVLEVYANIV
jgi:hypothetical protein